MAGGGRTCFGFGLQAAGRKTWTIPLLSIGDSYDFAFSLADEDESIHCREITITASSSVDESSYVRISFPHFEYGRPAYGCYSCGECSSYGSDQCEQDLWNCRECNNGGKRWVSIVGSEDNVCFKDQRYFCGSHDGADGLRLPPSLGTEIFRLPIVLTVVSAPSGNFNGPFEGSFTARVTSIAPPTPMPTPNPVPPPTSMPTATPTANPTAAIADPALQPARNTCSSCVDEGCIWCRSDPDSQSRCLCDSDRYREGRTDDEYYYSTCGDFLPGSTDQTSCDANGGLGPAALAGIATGVVVALLLGIFVFPRLRKRFVAPPSSDANQWS